MDIDKAKNRLIIANKLYSLIVNKADLSPAQRKTLEDKLDGRKKQIALYKKKIDSTRPHKSLQTDYKVHIICPSNTKNGKIILRKTVSKLEIPIVDNDAQFNFLFILAQELEKDIADSNIKPIDHGWRTPEELTEISKTKKKVFKCGKKGTLNALVSRIHNFITEEIQERYPKVKEEINLIEVKKNRYRLSVPFVETEGAIP